MVSCHGFPESWYSWRHQLPPCRPLDFTLLHPRCAATAEPLDRRRSPYLILPEARFRASTPTDDDATPSFCSEKTPLAIAAAPLGSA